MFVPAAPGLGADVDVPVAVDIPDSFGCDAAVNFVRLDRVDHVRVPDGARIGRNLVPIKSGFVGVGNEVHFAVAVYIREFCVVRMNCADVKNLKRHRLGFAGVQEQFRASDKINPTVAIDIKCRAANVRVSYPYRMTHPFVRSLEFPPADFSRVLSSVAGVTGNPIQIAIPIIEFRRSLKVVCSIS